MLIYELPIDPSFQTNRVATICDGLRVWKDASSRQGIYGTTVAVDFDLCIGDGACIEVCADVERKAIPAKERDCIYCFGCEAVCPKSAIRVTKLEA